MKELADLIETWRRLPPSTPVVLATVVATSGSTYRRAGARMLLTPQGWAAGSISGGCLEGDVVQSAWTRTADGPALVTYDATADEDILWGFGLGCNGMVQVLLERLPPDGGVLAAIADAFSRRAPITLATVISPGPDLGHRLPDPGSIASALGSPNMPSAPKANPLSPARGVGERSEPGAKTPPTRPNVHVLTGVPAEGCHRFEVEGYGDVLVEHILPPRPLLVFGAGHDAIPLVSAAKALGWHVTVIDARAGYANPARFPNADAVLVAPAATAVAQLAVDGHTAAVVMAHHYLNDLASLRELLRSAVGYIGLLGPARRSRRLIDDLRAEGIVPSESELDRVHSPIGLDLGAEGPDEIALAVVAEILAFFKGRCGGYLTGRASSLHSAEVLRCARSA